MSADGKKKQSGVINEANTSANPVNADTLSEEMTGRGNTQEDYEEAANANANATASASASSTPPRVHRTVSTEEFKKIIQEFQVKLPHLSYLPHEWIDEYNYTSANNSNTNSNTREYEKQKQHPKHEVKEKIANLTTTNIINLPNLSNDIVSHILAFVPHLNDILNYSQTCKGCYDNGYNNDLVWDVKFKQRWNASLQNGMIDPIFTIYDDALLDDGGTDDTDDTDHSNVLHDKKKQQSQQKELFWRRCYYNAFHNIHDLWVSHWNCVLPIDGVSPGRTLIPDIQLQRRSTTATFTNATTSNNTATATTTTTHQPYFCKAQQPTKPTKCPTCRYHPYLNRDGLDEINNAMDNELAYANNANKYKNPQSQSTTSNTSTSEKQQKTIIDPVDESECTLAMYSILLQRKLNGRTIENILDIESPRNSSSNSSSTTTDHQNGSTTSTPSSSSSSPTQSVKSFLDNLISRCNLKVTPATAIHQSTQYSLAKFCRRMRVVHNMDLSKRVNNDFFVDLALDDEDGGEKREEQCLDEKEGLGSGNISTTHHRDIDQKRKTFIHAFEQSATFRRKIDANQYRSSGLNFLTDALFFPIEPSHKRLHQLESVVNDETDKHGSDPSQVHWSYKMTDTEHAILDIYGSKIACTDDASRTTTIHNLPQAQPMAPLTDLKNVPAHDLSTLASLGSCHETAQHSWHVIRMSNPDFSRPITFRVYAQRKDCFAAYPSEGYLLPGETCHVTLGIRAMGSLLAHAFDDTDVKREEAHIFVSDVLLEESVLPKCGYCIRYFYAPTVPCVPSDHQHYKGPLWFQPSTTPQVEWIPQQNSEYESSGMIERLWNNIQSENVVRTLYISTHVNGNYAFDEFQNRTMSPFELNVTKMNNSRRNDERSHGSSLSSYPLTLISPNLMKRDPELFHLLHDLETEIDSSHKASTYRTEKMCECCGCDWGARSEYLGRVFVLRKAVCDEYARQQSRQMHRLLHCLKGVPPLLRHILPQEGISKMIDVDTNLINKVHQMLFCLHAILLNRKGDKLVSRSQRKMLRSCEIYETIASQEVLRLLLNILFDTDKESKRNEEQLMFWRQAGIYEKIKSSNCSSKEKDELKHILEAVENTAGIVVKKEPAYLSSVTDLTHQPGILPVGKQDDPNHVDDNGHQFLSDMYKDSAILGFTAAMATIQDPSALIGQGVYHKLPGSIPRCHKIEMGSFLPSSYRTIENTCIKGLKKIKSLRIPQSQPAAQKRDSTSGGWINFSMNDEDADSLGLIAGNKKDGPSFPNFSKNASAPGVGKRVITSGKIGRYRLPESIMSIYTGVQRIKSRDYIRRRRARRARPMLGHFGGLRFLNAMWYLSRQIGLSVDDEAKPGEIYVDRRIMIATQWMSNSLMFIPLLWTLVARWAMVISPLPLDYYLDGLPYDFKKDIRYLSSNECGWFAILVLLLWLGLGRHAERCINCTYERSMLDSTRGHRRNNQKKEDCSYIQSLSLWVQIIYDAICPLTLQRKIFLPEWNKLSLKAIVNDIRHARSADNREQCSSFYAKDGQQASDRVLPTSKPLSFSLKALLCCMVGLGSFASVSPHFVHNFCTVFFGSIGMGLSVSLNFMEIARSPQVNTIFAKFDNIRFNVAILSFFLVAQLVGASGGLQFLAEFVVTVVGFLLGGFSTVSSNGFENWFCFFCLSSVSFWGYLFARVGLSVSIRTSKSSTASSFLTASFLLIFSIWTSSLFNFDQDFPSGVMVVRFRNVVSPKGSAADVLSGRHILKV